MNAEHGTVRLVLIVSVAIPIAFASGRASASEGLLSRAKSSKRRIATTSGGALAADDVRGVVNGMPDPRQRPAAVEQPVRARLLTHEADTADLGKTLEPVLLVAAGDLAA